MTWLPAAIAWAGALVSLGALLAIRLLLRRFMKGPPKDRHWGANGRP